ncbi:hypothetical protein HK102_007539, partial [Quaeritorhiza haematococci]
ARTKSINVDDIDVDSIPIVHLSLDDLQRKDAPSKGKKRSKKSKPRDDSPEPPPRPIVKYEINTASEMPEGAVAGDSDDDAEEEARRRALDPDTAAVMSVDLTQLDVSEAAMRQGQVVTVVSKKTSKSSGLKIRPSSAASASSVAVTTDVAVAVKSVKKKASSKKVKASGGDGEGGAEAPKKKGKKKVVAGVDTEKTDIGKGKKVKTKEGKKTKTTKTQKKDVQDINSTTEATSFTTPSALSSDSALHGDQAASYDSIPSPATGLTPSASGEEPSSTTQQTPPPPVSRLLYVDEHISVGYDWKVPEDTQFSPDNPCIRVVVSFVIMNVGQVPISTVKLRLAESNVVKLSRLSGGVAAESQQSDESSDGEPPVLEWADDLPSGRFQVAQLAVTVNMENATQCVPAQVLEGVISYAMQETPRESGFQLALPYSINLEPSAHHNDVDPSRFASLLADSANFPFSASTTFSIPSADDLNAVVGALTTQSLRLGVVEVVQGAMSVYGRSVQGWHVAGLIKVRTKVPRPTGAGGLGGAGASGGKLGGVVMAELKCGNRQLIDGLIDEVNDWSAEL